MDVRRRRLIEILAAGGGAALLLVAVVLAVSREGGVAPPPAPTPVPTRPDEVAVALVNGQPIALSYWTKAVLIDQVMSGLAGVPAPSPEDTLEQLINQALVLQAVPSVEPPSDAEVEAYIASLEAGWGVTDQQVVAALEAAGLSREAWHRAVARLLMVQRGREALAAEGVSIQEWLARQRAEADIVIYRDRMAQAFAAPSPVFSPTPAPSTAPDFELELPGGGTFSLADQRTEGPVVLVFFQRCG